MTLPCTRSPAAVMLMLALLMLALPLAAPAAAQDMPTVLPNNYVLSDILNRQRVDTVIGSATGGAAGPPQRQVPSPPPAAATTYRAAPEVSARVRRQFADWMGRQAGAEGGRRIAEAMVQRDPVRNWAQIVGGDGLRPGDLADTMASYWILNWVMANTADSNRAQAQAVRNQVRPIIVSNPDYARLGEAQRQEMSEVLMLNFLVQHAAYVDAVTRGDRATIRRLGDAAVARFRNEMGVDLRRLELTNAGFVRAD
ncbi:DUF6683 family protein [Azospirillum picis]|uniref:Secreted protein n=1 Tax=Azospirillum picis TaxID=488438 RepID=A0ABU0MLG0_9PROT|nr:DUF6683 family protein [Azospirillum picis]MBP2301082.1 hypothetical protein [Azospirillum picis]MDQ0534298.1 hypothetical protein [Azospirillum picis]